MGKRSFEEVYRSRIPTRDSTTRTTPSGGLRGPRTYEGYSEAKNPGVLKWYCEEDAFFRYFREVGTGCSICFRVCSFTKPDTAPHRIVKWFIRNVPQLNRFWAWANDLMG